MSERRKTKAELIGELLTAVRANQNATDQMDDAAARGMGVNRTDARCLDTIEQFGPITAGRLAEAAGLTTGAVTAVIDRLVTKGYLRRVPDPGDRRRVMVEATEELGRRAGRYYGPLAAQATPFLSRYSNADLATIADFLRASTEIVERRAREVRAELAEETGRP
jgi:DNA-binding MarR family transcriptional regulator